MATERSRKQLLEFLHARVSSPKLTAPAPQGDLLRDILLTASRAPDHKVLKPARYLIIEGEALHKLGEIFADAAYRKDPNVSEAKLSKCRAMPSRAPMLLVAVSRNIEHPKVPTFEQEQSVAAGLTHILLALQATGFGGMWRTGEMAVDSYVKEQLGVAAQESIVGFLYIGTPCGEARRVSAVEFNELFQYWA